MRKRLISSSGKATSSVANDWLELEHAALVEVTSEADGYPVEGALLPDQERGWRAGTPGTQIIRLLFDQPQTIRRIHLVFSEYEAARTQEFLLRWLPHGTAGSWKEIVRQQWNFSPPDTVEECEEYKIDLASAAALELSINPDVSQQGVRASLEEMRLSVGEEVYLGSSARRDSQELL
jgi:hypothetical protein